MLKLIRRAVIIKARLIAADRITFSRHQDKNRVFYLHCRSRCTCVCVYEGGGGAHVQKIKHSMLSQRINVDECGSCTAAVCGPSDSTIQQEGEGFTSRTVALTSAQNPSFVPPSPGPDL